jgi:hypothetical protein
MTDNDLAATLHKLRSAGKAATRLAVDPRAY